MKLNKRGWGLVAEIIIILIAVILLVYAIYGLNQLGLIRNMDEALPGIKPDLIISGETTNYYEVENSIIEASKQYVSDRYSNDFVGDKLVIRVNHLIKNSYLSTIRDENNKECSGYVMVIKNETDVSYTPYLKCNSYQSDGYEEEYDW